MKILMIADHEEKAFWDNWSAQTAERLADVGLILSAGDLHAGYLEFLVTMLNVPLVFVRGNHDSSYRKNPPEGCIDADGQIVEVTFGGSSPHKIRILGLGGSMRYTDDDPYMYTEKEMKKRIAAAGRVSLKEAVKNLITDRSAGEPDILLTHAPCRGYGDLDDMPHRGFECFNDLLDKYHPKLHVYGHVHRAYSAGTGDGSQGFRRVISHPSGTTLINASGYYIYDIPEKCGI